MSRESGPTTDSWLESLQRVFSPEEARQASLILLRLLGQGGKRREAPLGYIDLAALVALAEARGFRDLPQSIAQGEEVVGAKLMALLLLYRSALEGKVAASLLAAAATLDLYGRGQEVVRELLSQGAAFGGKRE